MRFAPSREAGLARLEKFAPRAGKAYAQQRNYDLDGHPHVSGLSPYIRHRLLSEDEVIRAVLKIHSPREAEKFIAEVYWRTYWKGWLERRPIIWDRYEIGLQAAWNRCQTETRLCDEWQAACAGETGIDCFDHWARELVETGYLHNHARMWFASIWIFTLRLPWELGADFFLRHLLDGDPASNTLSWRWVGGLQTVGKTYLADPDNIAGFTNDRFQPKGLATQAAPLAPEPAVPLQSCPSSDLVRPNIETAILVTVEDLSRDASSGWTAGYPKVGLAPVCPQGPRKTAPQVTAFRKAALASTLGAKDPIFDQSRALLDWAHAQGIKQLVHAYTPVGPEATRLQRLAADLAAEGITVAAQLRPSDAAAWPHATAGFFKFKRCIPALLSQI